MFACNDHVRDLVMRSFRATGWRYDPIELLFLGCRVIVDPTLPNDRIEIRSRDAIVQIIQIAEV